MARIELMHKLCVFTFLRRVSTHSNRLQTTELMVPVVRRSASIFYLLRSRLGGKSKDAENASNDREWLDTVQEVEKSGQLNLKEPTLHMTRTELRKWKKRAFLHILEMFIHRSGPARKGFNAFIQHGLKKMPEYEVADDLECYKAIVRLFPVERMTVKSYLQADFGHFPKQQSTMIDILNRMVANRVLPDDEFGQMIINIFGWRNHAMQHYRRIMYWIPKLRHCNPWPVQPRIIDDLDHDPVKLGYLIAERICPDRMTEFTVVQIPGKSSSSTCDADKPDSLISAQSPEQRALLAYCTKQSNRNANVSNTSCPKPTIYLDGPHYVWYLTLQAVYYTLWTEIDSNRLRREIDSVQANRLSKHSAEKPWDSTFLKYSKDSSDLVLNSSHLKNADHLLLPHASLLTAINPVNTEAYQLDQNTADTRFIAKSEPEYDHRWLTIRQSHTYNYLPNSLCQHEQAEGTVLAVAVVVPKPDALENQKKLYEWEVSNRVDRLDSQDSFRQKRNDERSCFLQVPLPASSSLIRLWLNELQSKNPCFNNATLVIRVPMNVESRTTPNMDGDITSDNDLHTEDNQNDLKTQKSYN